MPVYIDTPEAAVTSREFRFAGWAATDDDTADIEVLVNGRAVQRSLVDRPALRGVPELRRFAITTGVVANVELGAGPMPAALDIVLRCGREQASRTVALELHGAPGGAAEESPQQRALRTASRAWVEARLRCPRCKSRQSAFSRDGGALRCASCASAFPQPTTAVNMILPEMGLISDVSPTSNVSSNPYSDAAKSLIETTTARGGWVLDCGAGRRPERLANVVNVEIVDYPSTDVLAVGESLPFKDESFDAAVSLAVLEHVRDPFQCAREIMRVLKPGGRLRADVPFLQPSHGYPHHYYNMTKQGLENLFAGLGDIVESTVPLHGQPILAVQWILSQYLAGLPPDVRRDFSRMTIGEAAALDPIHFLTSQQPAVLALSEEAREIIGCLNTVLVRKR